MPTQNRPNILWLLSDEHNHRFMGHYGEGAEPVHTPTFDGLAAGGTVFTDAYCQMPLCTPSRMCMLSGRDVLGCGAWTNGSVLRPDLATIPKTFAAAGYETCLVGKMHFGGDLQYHGFQHRPYGDLNGECGHQWEPLATRGGRGMRSRTVDAGVTEIPASMLQDEVVAAETVAWVREHGAASPEQPWLLCASFSRPHFPLTAPRRWIDRYTGATTRPRHERGGDAWDHPMSVGMRRGFRADDVADDEMMRARTGYFACVSYLDEVIGDLLLRLRHAGLLENTIIVYTSDHGEMAGEHGVWWKNGWYEACTRIPLIVSTPEQRRGEAPAHRVTTPVGLGDLFPTLCGLADVVAPDDLAGADLSASVRSGSAPADRPIACDSLNNRWGDGTEFRMIRQGRWKYVGFRDASELLFDLAADPDETRNLAVDPAGEAAAILPVLRAAAALDYAEIEVAQAASEGLRAQHPARFSHHAVNAYSMPDGRVIAADSFLYTPDIVAAGPDVFGDSPSA